MKTLIQNFGFFILLFIATGLFYFYNYNPYVYYGVFVGSLLITFLLEKKYPFEVQWTKTDANLWQDIMYAISTIFISPIAKVAVTYILVAINIQAFHLTLFSNAIPFPLVILTGLLLSGFLPYWHHRLSHTKSSLLWKIHAIHHSPDKIYWLNGFRLHPINAFLTAFLSLIPLQILGFSKESILLVSFINNYVAILNHTNINFKLGAFNYIFNMNEVHRWHHSNIETEGNSNYSSGALVFWDLLFNSFYLPQRLFEINQIGLFDSSKKIFPKKLISQLIFPFKLNQKDS
ncbi:MAG: sterol desaturase family protein [Limnohabitans sp.]|nr:sterol desaturase family protein [Limnohabitans sp.]